MWREREYERLVLFSKIFPGFNSGFNSDQFWSHQHIYNNLLY